MLKAGSAAAARSDLRFERFDYGWVVAGTLAITVTVSYGVLMYAFPVVLDAMQVDPGLSQQALTGAWSAGMLAGGAAAIPAGRWLDRHGPHALMTASALAAAILVAAWSRVHTPLALVLVWIGLGLSTAGLFYEPAFATVTRWFDTNRARAITLITIAGGLAGTIFVPLTARLVESHGWRDAVLTLALILAGATIVPHALVLRRSPPLRLASGAANGTAGPHTASRRSATLRRIITPFFLATVVNMAFAVHLIPLLLSRGHSLAAASAAFAGVGVAKLAGRTLMLPAVQRVPSSTVTIAILLVQAAALLLLIRHGTMTAAWITVILFGMGDGAITPARGEIVAEHYGIERYGTVSGLIAMFLAGARAIGPVGASLLFAAGGGYEVPLWAMVTLLLAAALSVRTLATTARPPRAASFPRALRPLL